MAIPSDHIRGVVHGRVIELEQELGLPEGQAVIVTVQPALPPGEGIRQSAGSWSDNPREVEAWLAEMRRSRRAERGNPSL